ncbi:MAG TPA: glycosyltransferase [Candidatus Sulfotelmatobacter sp.]|nr:glycosyltransferase [Candidatus Sulfotelmatobacter sp.]
MPGITALVHTHNDALRIGRCLETLYPCDEILIVDHGSSDGTVRVAQEYGARIARAGIEPGHLQARDLAGCDWLLCLDARESLTESLAASLYEWKTESPAANSAFSIFVREETAEGWIENPRPQTRLVRSIWDEWQGRLPANEGSACTLEGDLLRFVLP